MKVNFVRSVTSHFSKDRMRGLVIQERIRVKHFSSTWKGASCGGLGIKYPIVSAYHGAPMKDDEWMLFLFISTRNNSLLN